MGSRKGVRGIRDGEMGGNWAEYANNMCAWHATGIHFNLLPKELSLSKRFRLDSKVGNSLVHFCLAFQSDNY